MYTITITFIIIIVVIIVQTLTLTFDFPPFSRIEYEEKLRAVAYCGLETFESERVSVHTATCIIQNSGSRLRKISIGNYYFDDDTFNDVSLNFIRKIYEN